MIWLLHSLYCKKLLVAYTVRETNYIARILFIPFWEKPSDNDIMMKLAKLHDTGIGFIDIKLSYRVRGILL